MNIRFTCRACLFALLVCACFSGAAGAQNVFWDGSNSGSWNLGDNWSSSSVPGSSETAVFNAAGTITNPVATLDGNQSVAGIILDSNLPGGITLGNGTGTNTLTIGASGITVNPSALTTGTHTFNNGFTVNLGANQTWNLNAGSVTFTLKSTLDGTGLLTKTGVNTLFINTISNTTANTFSGGLRIYQGTVQAESPTNPAADGTILRNPLGTGAIELAGGQLNLRYDADNTTSPSRKYTFGNALNVTQNSTINMDRFSGSGGQNRSSLFSSLNIAAGKNLTIAQTNGYRLGITGQITFNNDATMTTGDLINYSSGSIVASGTVNKLGGNTFSILANNTYTGGTVIGQTGAGGVLRVGSGSGVESADNNANAKAGTGPIMVNGGNRAAFSNLTNIATGQTIDFVSNIGAHGVFELNTATVIPNIRAMGSGRFEVGAGATFTQSFDPNRLGDKTWRFGSSTTFGGNTTMGAGASLTTGAGNVYRVGGAGGTLVIDTVNLFSGTAGIDVGGGLVHNSTPGGSGTVLLNSTNLNTYTGVTTVNRGSTLRFRRGGATGSSLGTTSAIDLFGTITAESSGTNHGTFFNSSGAVIPVNIFGGSKIFFDNSGLTSGGDIDRWDNDTDMAWSHIDLEHRSRNIATSTSIEQVGDVTFTGGNIVRMSQGNSNTANISQLTLASLTRSNGGTIELVPPSTTGLGAQGRLVVTTGAPTPSNGMTTPWIINHPAKSHVTYGANGFANVTYLTSAALNNGTELLNISSLASSVDVYALKQTGALTDGTRTARIRSGGFIADFAGTSGTPVSVTNTANLNFTDTSTVEGHIFVDDNDTLVQSGTLTADGFTKFGSGNLTLTADNAAGLTSGTIYVNRGTLQLEHANAAGNRPIVLTTAGTLNLRAAAAATFNNGVTVAANQPTTTINVARPSTTGDNQILTIPTLTLAGVSGVTGSAILQGQTINVSGANNYDLRVSGATNVSGNVVFNVNSGGSELYVDGGFTSNTAGATLTKSGGQVMRIMGNNTVAANTKVHINGGTLELRNTSTTNVAATPLGAGGANGTTIYLNTGTLAFRGDLSTLNNNDMTMGGTSATAGGYNVFVQGDSTISVDRFQGSANDRRVRIGNLTIGSQTLNIAGAGSATGAGNSWYFYVNGTTTLNGDPTFNTSAPAPELSGKVSGGRIIKQGSATLRLSAADNTNDFNGGMIVQQGWAQGYNARAFGTGKLDVLPGGGVALGKTSTLLTGQTVSLRSSSWGLPMIGTIYAGTHAPSTLLPYLELDNATSGIFAPGGNYTGNIDMSDLFGATVSGDDDWYLGAVAYSDSIYNGNTLAPGAGNTYRLGGGGGNMRLNRNGATNTTTGAVGANATNLLTGNASVTLGLPAHNLRGNSGSSVLLTATNDYTGGTVVNRGMNLHLGNPVANGNSGAGTGMIDVYGVLSLRSFGSLADLGPNINEVKLHPGSRVSLDSNDSSIGMASATVQDRWGDDADLTLDGARLDLVARSEAVTLNETIGDVTFGRGSTLRVARNTNNASSRAYLTIGSLNRVNHGTLRLDQGAGALPDQTVTDGLERIMISGTAPMITNGMVAPYIIDTSDQRFVTYNASLGFQQVDFNQSNINSATDTERVGLSTAATLSTNPVMYALKSTANISASGNFNTVTVRSGGFIASGGTHTANFAFKDAGNNNIEALIYTGADTVFQGTVTASQITKFGSSELRLDRALGVYDGPVVVNDGAVRLLQLNALSANSTVLLQGGGSAAGHATEGTGLYFAANIASGAEQVYTHGTITSVDNNRILFIMGGNDRTQRIGNIVMDTTLGNPLSVLQLRVENNRTRAKTGSITFNSPEAILHVHNNSFGAGGAASVVAPSALVGNNKDITKLGVGMLELGGLTSNLTNSDLIIGQGALRITDSAALGTDNRVVIDTGAALEIATSNFALQGTTTLTQKWGSGERWSVADARGTGNYSVPTGVNLQINTNIEPGTPRTITLNGGSIEGFLYTDANAKAVYRMLGSNLTLDLATHSYIGQNLYVGPNGSDAGMQGLFPDRNPINGETRGSILVVNGPITGANSDLTKIGRDMVVIGGTEKTYRNTIVEQGILRIGADNALPNGGILTTRFDAAFDLNGYNQTVGNLGTKDGDPNPGGVGVGYSGRVTNTAYETRSLTTGNADNYTYAGQILATVALTKVGSGALTLTGDNSYLGDTAVNAGTLLVNGKYTGSGTHQVADTATLGGTGTISSMVTLATGGTLDPGVTTGIITVAGMSLSATGAGSNLEIDITSPGVAGTNYDQVSVTSSEILAGNLRVQLGYTPSTPNDFIIIANATGVTRSGSFATLNGQPLVGDAVSISGIDYTLNYNGGDGNDVVLTVAVPEPSTLMLFGAMGAALLLRRRR